MSLFTFRLLKFIRGLCVCMSEINKTKQQILTNDCGSCSNIHQRNADENGLCILSDPSNSNGSIEMGFERAQFENHQKLLHSIICHRITSEQVKDEKPRSNREKKAGNIHDLSLIGFYNVLQSNEMILLFINQTADIVASWSSLTLTQSSLAVVPR